jgi:hypothetical protein
VHRGPVLSIRWRPRWITLRGIERALLSIAAGAV